MGAKLSAQLVLLTTWLLQKLWTVNILVPFPDLIRGSGHETMNTCTEVGHSVVPRPHPLTMQEKGSGS